MRAEYKALSWEEVYKAWEVYSHRYCSVNLPLEIKPEFTPCRFPDSYMWGYDWIENQSYTERVDRFKIAVNDPYSNIFTPLNKGTLHTLQMLVDSQDEEERAAIWIYAFCHDLTQNAYGMKSRRICMLLKNAALSFLKDRFCIWHHAMRQLTPEMYIPTSLLYEGCFEDFEPVVELIILNSYLIRKEYSVALYHSSETTEPPSDHHSVHLSKRET